MSDQDKINEYRKKMAQREAEENLDIPSDQPQDGKKTYSNSAIDLDFVRKCFDADELGASLLFNHIHRGKFVCNLVSGEWLTYIGPHWELDYQAAKAKAAVENVCKLYVEHLLAPLEEKIDTLDTKEDKEELKPLIARRKEILTTLQQLRRDYKKNAVLKSAICNFDPLSIHHNDLDQRPWLFPVANGVYDLQYSKFYEGGRYDDYLTVHSPTKWEGKQAKCPAWRKFLLEILGNSQGLVDYLQRILGYAITGLRTEHVFVVFHGPHGRNGKGTLINVLRQVLGEMVSKINTEMLMSQKFSKSASGPSPDVMDMKSKRIIWASETEKGQSFAHGKVKEFSGGEPLKGRGLQDKYMTEFDVTHTLFLLCNDRPKAPPQDTAFWSRIRVITFPYSFEWKCTQPHHRPVDKDIEQKLLNEASGILAWLVEGNEMWRKDGECPPQQVIDDSQKYRDHVDDLREWIETQCKVDKTDSSTDNRESATLLYTNFRNWWDQHNTTRAMNQTEFSDQMQAKGFTKQKSGKIYYQYIRLIFTEETKI